MTTQTSIGHLGYSDFQRLKDQRRERKLRELLSDLSDLVGSGDITDIEACEWYNMKADQWSD